MSGWLLWLASAAFLTGLAGGVHCAAMCGPIVAACSGRARSGGARWPHALAYNAGRLASYTVAGVTVAAVGQGALALRGGPVAQQIALVAGGASMLLLALYLSGAAPFVRRIEGAGALVWRVLQPHTRRFLPVDTVGKALGLGALWGWLPCGMVYGALIIAAATGDALEGGAVMLSFGLGTLPNVIALNLFATNIRGYIGRPAVRVALAGTVAAAGVFAFGLAAHPAAAAAVLCLTR